MNAPPLLCAGLEIALNRYLALEPEVLAECGALQGRVIALHAEGPDWAVFLCPHARGVQVMDQAPSPPDVRIRARPAQLLRQALASGRGDASAIEGVRVEGDAGLLARFGSLLVKVGFDPEEWLARTLGGGAAHRVTGVLRGLGAWGRQAAGTLALDTAEYLREETRDLVHRDDVERWIGDVEALRGRAEGLARRLERLESLRA